MQVGGAERSKSLESSATPTARERRLHLLALVQEKSVVPPHTWHLYGLLLSAQFHSAGHTKALQSYQCEGLLCNQGKGGGFARGNHSSVALSTFSYSSFGAEARLGCPSGNDLNGAGLPMLATRERKGLGSPFRYWGPKGGRNPNQLDTPIHTRADRWKCRANAMPRSGTWPLPRISLEMPSEAHPFGRES